MIALLSLILATAAISPQGAVAAGHPLASEAGVAMLRHGGNAIDAAVAAAFTLAVVEPQSSGLGGGGFAVVYLARERKVRVIDFREVGPAAATPQMYVQDGKVREDLARDGPLAVAVPGAVRGYVELLKRFGKRPLLDVVAPAIELAGNGFRANRSYVAIAEDRRDCLAADPEASRIFLRRGRDGQLHAPEPGARLIQPDLTRTLKAIALHGADAFYKGDVARRIARTVQAGGGILTEQDLAAFQVRERDPIEGTYRGYRIVTLPPPSSGGMILIGLLNVLEREDPSAGGYKPEAFLHVMVEAEKRLFAHRERWGDPASNPGMADVVREMISKDYAGTLRASIGDRATPATQLAATHEGSNTTHISVVDSEGNAVGLTTTVNEPFGSCVVAQGTGVLLNDEMDDFASAPGVLNAFNVRGGAENAPGPGKVPLSSIAPTIVFAPDGALRMVLGSAGGSTIPTTVAQAIIHVVDDHMPIDRALAAPRIHDNLFPDAIRVEPEGLEAASARALEARGHKIEYRPRPWAKASGVEVDPQTRWRVAAVDASFDGAGAAQ
ncbi:MAG TPA: gamma-glutamyltransferase [Myxococcales bacterium]|nr:gamma-glutamyltransferase [Myxococcales bacterium]